MTGPVEVLRVGQINGQPVRFFASAAEVPDLPWVAIGDLQLAFGLPRPLRKTLMSGLLTKWAGDIREVTVAGRGLVIVPHFMAQAFVGSMVEMGQAFALAAREYAVEGGLAAQVRTTQLGLTGTSAMRWGITAAGGDPSAVVPMFDEATGQVVIRIDQLQAALGLDDAEVERSLGEIASHLTSNARPLQ